MLIYYPAKCEINRLPFHIPKLNNPLITTISITITITLLSPPLNCHHQHPILFDFNLSSAIQIGILECIYLL